MFRAVNYAITDRSEEHLQDFARGQLPRAPCVTSANGDAAYGSAAASGRETCPFLVFINVARATAVLDAALIVVPRVSLSSGAAGVANLGDALSRMRAGSVRRVLAALGRVCALAAGDAAPGDGEYACMLERAGRGRLASRKVFWASFITDNVWVRVYGFVGEAGKCETAFARALDFGPTGAEAALRSHNLARKPKECPPESRRDKKYVSVDSVPCGGVARLIANADDVDDGELLAEIAEDDADALAVERAEELRASGN